MPRAQRRPPPAPAAFGSDASLNADSYHATVSTSGADDSEDVCLAMPPALAGADDHLGASLERHGAAKDENISVARPPPVSKLVSLLNLKDGCFLHKQAQEISPAGLILLPRNGYR
eukprot:CAMPEP_0183401638 /NCGR_PEP_ID=MMETSP0370-20130417/13388_1 /TAXON_ID=268820 /ORGANISM="Peridinium aciculiferum, Strain PAER-2" /LENGTH=115 /DNA_ID=CAMNT_0025583115 /DNA_START=176 /DNA_END=520 /DNA_ORIENTATION=-